ncbi:MAG: hypothetical protein EXS51_03470 [Candidatus Taylorbacteria bacterium]|nr:hypothetical protein [Candidatus Taylorbacteria bacterium]
MTIPMDIGVVIVRRKEPRGALTHFATLVVGRPNLPMSANEEEVFRCNATGKSFFSCLAALKERVLVWAEINGVQEISGITNNEDCPLVLQTTSEEKITITPITYNDWILEVHL